MSYRRKHIKSKINKVKPKMSVLRQRWFWFTILFLIIIFLGIYFLLFYSGLQIKKIIISGNERIEVNALEKVIWENAGTKLINFGNIKIESLSILSVDKNKLKKRL